MPILQTSTTLSIRNRLARLAPADRRRRLAADPRLADALRRRDWRTIARPQQQPRFDLDWWIRFWCAGRRWGKSRAGSEALTELIRSGRIMEGIAAGRTFRETKAIQGRWLRRVGRDLGARLHETSMEMRYDNGAVVYLLSADKPEMFRGWGVERDEGTRGVGAGWADELGTWKTSDNPEDDPWTQMKFAVSEEPQRILVTTTPRPTDVMRELAADPRALVTFGSTAENRANLSARYYDLLAEAYGGTRLGEQELEGRILAAVEGTVFKRAWFEETRIAAEDAPPLEAYDNIVTAVDPNGSTKPDSDYTGIATVGLFGGDHLHTLYTTRLRGSPSAWAAEVARQYHRYGSRMVIAERNFGGDMVESVIRNFDPTLPVFPVWASRGKTVRFEPLSLLYEQRRVHHIGHHHVELEDELVHFTAASQRDDILDAEVYAAEYLQPSGSSFRIASTSDWDDF